jgi:hypothetical protein
VFVHPVGAAVELRQCSVRHGGTWADALLLQDRWDILVALMQEFSPGP